MAPALAHDTRPASRWHAQPVDAAEPLNIAACRASAFPARRIACIHLYGGCTLFSLQNQLGIPACRQFVRPGHEARG